MHIFTFTRILLLAVFVATHFQPLHAQETVCKDLKTMISLMDTLHVRPIAVDKILPESLPTLFFQDLDPSGLFLTRQDRATLVAKAKQAGPKGTDMACALYQSSLALYRKRLTSADSILTRLAATAPSYTVAETWVDDINDAPTATQTDRLRQLVKLQVLEIYAARSAESRGTFATAEPAIRAQVCERYHCRIQHKQHVPQGIEKYIGTIFLNAVATCYDPHSAYFSQDLKNEFEASLSTNAATFGFWVTENEAEEVAVHSLMPGSPAWNNDHLRKEDVITAMQFGTEPALKMACTTSDEINAMLASVPANKLTISIRHHDGQEEQLELHAREMEVESNTVSSYLLSGKVKAGYLYLPGFYSDWGSGDAQGCANDVARALLNMRSAGVEGVILDLRGNGGGSVEEALQLAGIFINEGPMGVFVNAKNVPSTLRDPNRGAIYSGPLVVMVDSWSASASEIFAAIMQDYHRAVVVGDTTYGKATAQEIFPLPGNPAAFVKITTDHVMRITGKSHQYQGVIPDITLPGAVSYGEHESDLPRVLQPGTLTKEIRYLPLPEIPIATLRQAALKRGQQSAGIALTNRFNERLSTFLDTLEKLQLKPEVFVQYNHEWEDLREQVDLIDSIAVTAYKATIPPHLKSVLELNPVLKETLENQCRDVQHNVRIEYAYQILSDMIKP